MESTKELDFSSWSMNQQNSMRFMKGGEVGIVYGVNLDECETEGDWLYSVERDEDDGAYAAAASYTGSAEEVCVPETLGGLPVRKLHDQVFMRNASLKKAVVPNCVREMGMKVFAFCAALEEVVLPDAMQELEPSTFVGCRALRTVHLPEQLKVLRERALYDCAAETYELPVCLEAVEEGVFNPRKVKSISVASGNAALSSDGAALYSADGSRLIRMVTLADAYTLPPACKVVGRAAFKGMTSLSSINLGQVEVVESFAFFRTGIAELVCPASLREIHESAFSNCMKLGSVVFNEGLSYIGPKAFSLCKGISVQLPASLEKLSFTAFDKPITDSPDFSISPENKVLFMEDGALYRRVEDGLEFCGLSGDLEEFTLNPATVAVLSNACEKYTALKKLVMPEGLKTIGDSAFKFCDNLASVNLPESLESIGDSAFWQTALTSVYIGANVSYIGKYALEVAGTTKIRSRRTIKSLTVSPENPKYYYTEYLLIERRSRGDRTLNYVGPEDAVVHVPEEVTELGDMTFFHADVRELHFGSRINQVSSRAMLGIDGLDHVFLAFPQPVDGVETVQLDYPRHIRDVEESGREFALSEGGEFFDFDTYDRIAVYEQDPMDVMRMALTRLQQPVRMSKSSKASLQSAVKGHMIEVLRRCAVEKNYQMYDFIAEKGWMRAEAYQLAKDIAEYEKCPEALEYLKNVKLSV